jgi:hypothetical protein
MDPDFDITLNSAEEPSSDLAKGHFLDSLGLGERSLLGSLPGDRNESLEEDGVVLSSLPDDLGFPMAGAAPDRGVEAYSTLLTSERADVAAISLPVEEDPQPEPEEVLNTAPETETETETETAQNLNESLHLHCPECRGSLVLKRLHLGIEGACVWCHTPIVAAESARDGQVRIFPILGHVAAAPVSEEVAPVSEEVAPVSEEVAPVSEEVAPVSEEVAPVAEVPAPLAETKPIPVETPEPPQVSVEIAPVIPSAVEEAPVDMAASPVTSSGFGDLLPSSAKEELPSSFSEFGCSAPPASNDPPGAEIDPPAEVATTTPDLDSLYETGGFLAAQSAPTLPVGFGETLAPSVTTGAAFPPAPTTPATEEAIPGFGAFLQAPQGLTPPAASPEPAPMVKVEEPAATAGFLTPTPWGPPAPISSLPAINPPAAEVAGLPTQDEAPAELPIGFGSPVVPTEEKSTPPTWEAAFGTANEMPVAAPIALPASPAPPTGFGEGFLSAGLATAAPSALFGMASEPAPSTNAGLSFQPSAAAKVQEEAKAIEDSRSFTPPFHAFSTGSSSDEEPGIAKNLFGDPSSASSLWGAGAASDEAPTLLAPLDQPLVHREVEPPFSADETETANPFADQTITSSPSLYESFQVADPDPTELDSAAATEAPAPAGPPALPATAMTAAVAPTIQPQVISQPLGSKPKPKVRKGFIVLMVVIVGFASGAALASFVLPVEEYVTAARAFMESKFGSGVAIPQMPAMPEGLAIPTEPAAPSEAQP